MILGIDPGSRWIGWCVLDGVRLGGCGVIDLEVFGEEGARAELLRLAGRLDVHLVAVERVSVVRSRPGGLDTKRAEGLVRAAWIGGEIACAFRTSGRPVVTFSAEDWRGHFLAGVSLKERAVRKAAGQKLDIGKAVRALCDQRIAGWPAKLPGVLAKDRSHVDDAGGVALYAPIAARRSA